MRLMSCLYRLAKSAGIVAAGICTSTKWWSRKPSVRPWMAGALLVALPPIAGATIHWAPVWHVQANGQRFSVESFSSAMSVDRVARELARQNDAFQRYVVGDGRLLLFGVRQGAHWLAEIQGQPGGAQGYVSALYFDAERARPLFWPETGSAVGRSARQEFQFESHASVSLLAAGAEESQGRGVEWFPPVSPAAMSLAVSLPEQ